MVCLMDRWRAIEELCEIKKKIDIRYRVCGKNSERDGRERETEWVWEQERESEENVCMWERREETDNVFMCVCVCVRESESNWECERDRESERKDMLNAQLVQNSNSRSENFVCMSFSQRFLRSSSRKAIL
jgi:hypothetical protein